MAQFQGMAESIELGSASGWRCLRWQPAHAEPAGSLIWLHGMGERGDDLSVVKRYGLPALLASNALALNAEVWCPQLDAGSSSWPTSRLAALIARLTQPVALVGFSLGGSGVCDLLAAHGALVPLAVSVAGQGANLVRGDVSGLRWLTLEGDLDPWPRTDVFSEGVRAAGGDVQRVVLAGQGHFISESVWREPVLADELRRLGLHLTWA